MRRRMVAPDRAAADVVDFERQRLAHLEGALLNFALMHEQVAGLFLGVGDGKLHAVGGHRPDVADLTPRLAIERRLVENNRAGFASIEFGDLLSVADKRCDDALRSLGVVAEKFGGSELFAERKPG